mgnify:CR=1 FL=1
MSSCRATNAKAVCELVEQGEPPDEACEIILSRTGKAFSPTWHLVADAPEPVKAEPFKLEYPLNDVPGCLRQIEEEFTLMRKRLAQLEAAK